VKKSLSQTRQDRFRLLLEWWQRLLQLGLSVTFL
jgi:hypothetical protein